MIDVSEDLNKLKNSKLRAQNHANYAYALIERLLLDLWKMKDIDNDTKIKFMNYKVFYKLISQPFYHSRTLLGISLLSEILKIV